MGNRRVFKHDRDAILAAYDRLGNAAAVARELDIYPSVIYKTLKIERPGRAMPAKPLPQAVRDLLDHPDERYGWTAGVKSARIARSPRERLFDGVVMADGCMEVVTQPSQKRPLISFRNHMVNRARAVFYMLHGYEPVVVRHSCDNPRCINPEHLLGGDYHDNVADMIERGRAAWQR